MPYVLVMFKSHELLMKSAICCTDTYLVCSGNFDREVCDGLFLRSTFKYENEKDIKQLNFKTHILNFKSSFNRVAFLSLVR